MYEVDAGKRKPLPSRRLRQNQIRYGYKLDWTIQTRLFSQTRVTRLTISFDITYVNGFYPHALIEQSNLKALLMYQSDTNRVDVH